MKRLILVRHAKTEPLTDALSDFERQLKKRGHNDARLVANELKDKGFCPDTIISSPAVRAIQTARVFADVFEIPALQIKQAGFIYDGETTAGLLSGITSMAGGEETVLVVGHNPDIAMLSMRLTGEAFAHFPTTATLVIAFSASTWSDISVGTGRAEYFVYPRLLKDEQQ
ncbi:SixA phosphatase family protein [Alkaliflexus imshenetskii]|uniref:SixA phosphatase family protein n=1 Tax=Alkaliflexus imshenetskii TaxID=286730 RepID=UPI0004B3B5E1|nr:histidine phosphatase family protein [Alkaliflexus imshenetskii]